MMADAGVLRLVRAVEAGEIHHAVPALGQPTVNLAEPVLTRLQRHSCLQVGNHPKRAAVRIVLIDKRVPLNTFVIPNRRVHLSIGGNHAFAPL